MSDEVASKLGGLDLVAGRSPVNICIFILKIHLDSAQVFLLSSMKARVFGRPREEPRKGKLVKQL